MTSTVNSEISALQVKLLYLQFKSIKINNEMNSFKDVSEFDSTESPEAIKSRGEIAYSVIDVIALFENYHSFANDVFNSTYPLTQTMESELIAKLKTIRKVTAQWKHVRNKIGGHLEIDRIKDFCGFHNYKGVFLSNNLEADFKGVLLPMMLGSAINSTLSKSRLFDSELNLTDPQDMNRFIIKFNESWKLCIDLFADFSVYLYKIGKQEKLAVSSPQDIGLIKF